MEWNFLLFRMSLLELKERIWINIINLRKDESALWRTVLELSVAYLYSDWN